MTSGKQVETTIIDTCGRQSVLLSISNYIRISYYVSICYMRIYAITMKMDAGRHRSLWLALRFSDLDATARR